MALSSGVLALSFKEIDEITDGFSPDRVLGTGAFGKVYKGVHNNGEKIAVKVLHDMTGLDDKLFMNEFNNLRMLEHPNIVKLVGCCNETRKKYIHYEGRLVVAEEIKRALCLEYVQNGSLDKYLFDEDHGQDWNTRYAIIKGICMGLNYLHEGLEPSIYHLDLKPANILLGENMEPKIADFGLSRLFGEEKTRITKSRIGTLGYLPPEYIDRNIISNKLDVFSLGVIVIKIITGRDGYAKSYGMPPQHFIQLVQKNWRNRLQKPTDSEQVKRCMEIALSCVEMDRCNRPTIGEIVHELIKMETVIQKLSPQLPHWLRNYPIPHIKQENDAESSMEIRQWPDLRLSTRSMDSIKSTGGVSSALPHLAHGNSLHQRLKAIIEQSSEEWYYAIFWQSSLDLVFEDPLLSWGDCYKRRHDDKSGKHQHRSTAQDVDIEFFFHVSMTKPFPHSFGLPGMALFTGQPSWTAADLSDVPCSRARDAYTSGFRTMICIPVSDGVIELGSTQVILQTTQGLEKLRWLIHHTGFAASSEPLAGVSVSNAPTRPRIFSVLQEETTIKDTHSGLNSSCNPLLKLSLGRPEPVPLKSFPMLNLTLFNNDYE